MEVHNQLPLVVVDDNLETNDHKANNADEESYVTCVYPYLVVSHGLVLIADIGRELVPVLRGLQRVNVLVRVLLVVRVGPLHLLADGPALVDRVLNRRNGNVVVILGEELVVDEHYCHQTGWWKMGWSNLREKVQRCLFTSIICIYLQVD